MEKVAGCSGCDETNADGDFKSVQKPAENNPNPTKGSSRLDMDDLLLCPPTYQFSPHFELQQNLKDVAEAKQSLIMTQQRLRREVMLNSGAERQHNKLQRIPRKCDDAKDLNFHHGGQDCRYVNHDWPEYSWSFQFFKFNLFPDQFGGIYIFDHPPK